MKEIKFRLIRDNKIVGYETHVVDPTIGVGICIYHKTPKEKKLKYGYPITGGDKWFIFHDTKDQYIGLEDKNGIEIYEKDIIHIDDNKHIWTVGYGCFGDAKYYAYNQLNSCREIEVDITVSMFPFFSLMDKPIDLEINGHIFKN